MEDEIVAIEKNGTWLLVNRHCDKRVLDIKWVYRTKLDLNGLINLLIAMLVVKGCL